MEKILWIDIETRSRENLITRGLMHYAMHPTTELICLAYAIDDEPVTSWFAEDGEEFPPAIIDHIKQGGIFKAHNAQFERYLFDFVISNDYDFQPPKLEQWRCTSVQAMAHGLPASLEMVCRAMDLPIKKQSEGKRLIRDYCAPCFSTEWKEGDKELMRSYVETDVETMRQFAGCLRELDDWEWEQYHVTERMNDRGVPIQVDFAEAALAYSEQVKKDVDAKIQKLTGGAVRNARARKARDNWLLPLLTDEEIKLITKHVKGEAKISLDKEHQGYLINSETLHPDAKAFLHLLQDAGGSAVSKFKTMVNTHVDGRVYNPMVFSGAGATGRYSSRGLQLQNMRRDVFNDPQPYIDSILKNEPIDNPADTLGRLCRSAITSKDGLTYSDYSQIEARVLPWLADSPAAEKTLDIFREGRDLYSENAVGMFGLSCIEDVTKDLRQSAKVAVLACLHADSQVMTSTGIKSLIDVTTDDLLWDGEQWVHHEGVIYKGEKHIIEVDGLWTTQDHLIRTRKQWETAETLSLNPHVNQSAREIGLESLLSLVSSMVVKEVAQPLLSNVRAVALNIESWRTVCAQGAPLDVMFVQNKRVQQRIQNMLTLFQTLNFEKHCSEESQDVLCGALTQIIKHIRTMVAEALLYVKNGSQIDEHFLNTSLRSMDLITQSWSWIDSTTTGDMNTETLPSEPKNKIHKTDDHITKCSKESMSLSPVYDIVNAGANNCFTILTDCGAKIVHNCGFAGGYNALLSMAKIYGMTLSEDTARNNVAKWRAANPWAEPLWYGLKEAGSNAVRFPNKVFSHGRISFMYDGKDWLWLQLPSGRCLAYFQPRFEMVDYPWGDSGVELTFLWGSGKPKAGEKWPRQTVSPITFVQHATQATAADVMRETLTRADKAGLLNLFSVHDEMIIEGDHFDKLHAIMEVPPVWAEGLPIAADTQKSMRYGK